MISRDLSGGRDRQRGYTRVSWVIVAGLVIIILALASLGGVTCRAGTYATQGGTCSAVSSVAGGHLQLTYAATRPHLGR